MSVFLGNTSKFVSSLVHPLYFSFTGKRMSQQDPEAKRRQKLAELMAKRKAREAKKKAAQAQQNNANQNNANNEDEKENQNEESVKNIQLNVYYHYSNKVHTLRKLFNGDDRLHELRSTIAEELGLSIDDESSEGKKTRLTLIWMTKAIKEERMNDKISTLNVRGNEELNANIHIAFKVIGGAFDNNNKNDDSKEKERLPDFSNKNIKPSLEPDCIFDDKTEKLRVEMPCGHVFDSQTIYDLTKSYVLYLNLLFITRPLRILCFCVNYSPNSIINWCFLFFVVCLVSCFLFCVFWDNTVHLSIDRINDLFILCPLLDCQKKWNFDVVAAAGDFDKVERAKFSAVLEKRALLKSGNFKQCKGCNSFVAKPDDIKMIRVRCHQDSCKNRADFCWQCGEDWIGGGFAVCGNKDCNTNKINEVLQKCGTVKPEYLGGKIECPEIRVCPRCRAV